MKKCAELDKVTHILVPVLWRLEQEEQGFKAGLNHTVPD